MQSYLRTKAGSTEKTHVELSSKNQTTVERQLKFMGMYLGMYRNYNGCKALFTGEYGGEGGIRISIYLSFISVGYGSYTRFSLMVSNSVSNLIQKLQVFCPPPIKHQNPILQPHPRGHPPFSQITAGTSIHTNLDESFGKNLDCAARLLRTGFEGQKFFLQKSGRWVIA